ncbi:MAG TPA: 2-hydroxychromene-2-carboxylate isomerase [Polyangia bacterium]|jgi:2-hydroxychromene-2-carboxylate isomerase|nr:2-hydroxychromene-2-carboxylate isomerase [Polyangia bacterium]
MSDRRLTFYYDFSSPWSYLGSTQVERVAQENGATVEWRPILLGALFKAIGTPIVPLHEQSQARQRYQGRDLHHWADFWGVPFRFASRFPTNSVTALRMVLAAGEKDLPRLSHAIYRAYWAEDQDITDREVLARLASDLGLDGAALVARTEDPEIKARLREYTDGAVARGVFGVPTFFIGDTMVFGQDRFDFVAAALRGEKI